MSDVSKFNVNGQQLPVADGKARADAAAALDMESRLQQLISGKYAGRSLVEMFASEIVEYDDEWQWLQARVQAGEYSGMLPFDYIPVTLTSGFNLLYEIGHSTRTREQATPRRGTTWLWYRRSWCPSLAPTPSTATTSSGTRRARTRAHRRRSIRGRRARFARG